MRKVKFQVLLCGDKNLGRIPAKIFVLPEGAHPVEPFFILTRLAAGLDYKAATIIRTIQTKARGLRR